MPADIVIQFTLKELLALFGLAQSVYVLVYMFIRSGRISRAVLPVLFFTWLSAAFMISAAESHWSVANPGLYKDIEWLLWTFCAPLSTLLVLQVALIVKMPPPRDWLILLIVPAGYTASAILGSAFQNKAEWLQVSGIICGALSLLLIWRHRLLLEDIHKYKNGSERYWVILSLIILNVCLLILTFFEVNQVIHTVQSEMVRMIVGISFIYVAATSLFRIYPCAVPITPKEGERTDYLDDREIQLALKIERLINHEKVYHEPNYGRPEMAKDLGISEASLSKIVNAYFQKSVPQLLNGFRVEDAKFFLDKTDTDITTIATEAGFNSIATFNRVFKELEGVSPSDYRNR